MKCRAWFIALLISASWLPSKAQDADSLLLNELDSLLNSSDSLSILNLIDSILNANEPEHSQLSLRLAYNSNVLSTGRTLGIDQFGLSPGVTYFHKTGLYADVATYYSNDFNPNIYLTILSAGYMKSFGNHFSLIANYDRYIYNLDEDGFIPYSNSINISPYLEFNPATIRCDYTYFFGDKNVHRISPAIGLSLEKRKFMGFDRIAFFPSFTTLFGNETFEEIQVIFPKQGIEGYLNLIRYGTWYKVVITEKDVFGLMNYAFSMPLSFTKRNWSFSISYTYNIPKELEGETLSLSETGYVAASLSYYFTFRKQK